MKREILRMEYIQSFESGKQILNYAKLNLFEGETIGIIGDNYSGKSALIGGIVGFRPYEQGLIYYHDKPMDATSLSQARENGIFYIHEVSSLINEFSIEQNMFLIPEEKEIIIKKEKICEKAQEILQLFHIKQEAKKEVCYLSRREKLLVEIGRAALNQAEIIILDNVLNGISEKGLEEFGSVLILLKSLHISVILIETGIKYLKPYCDRLFVMREGQTVGVFNKSEIEENMIVSLMIGENFQTEDALREAEKQKLEKLILSMAHIYYEDVLSDISFQVYKGESVGILNVNKHSGHGIETLLSGKANCYKGAIFLEGIAISCATPEDTLAKGIVVLSENEQIFENFTIQENIEFMALKKKSTFLGCINKPELRYLSGELFSKYIQSFANNLHLEDGVPENRLIQKKVAFCRALAFEPKVLVCCNMTQTLDLFSKEAICQDIKSVKNSNITVIAISQDIRELLKICNRIIVVNEGAIDGEFVVNKENKRKLIRKFEDQIINI